MVGDLKKIIMKILKISAGSLIGLFVVLYGLTALVNWSDEDPAPGYAQYLAYDAPNFGTGPNALYMLNGLDAPADADPMEYGRQKLERMFRDHRSMRGYYISKLEISDRQSSRFGSGSDGSENGVSEKLVAQYGDVYHVAKVVDANGTGVGGDRTPQMTCPDNEMSCLAYYWRNRAEIEKRVQGSTLPLSRLHQAYGMDYFDQIPGRVKEIATPVLSTGYPYSSHELARIALATESGQLDQAIADLVAIGEFYRKVGANSQTLYGKNAGNRVVLRAGHLASDMLRELSLQPVQREKLAAILKPLSPEMLDYRDAYHLETMNLINVFSDLTEGERNGIIEFQFGGGAIGRVMSVVAPQVYQPQATRNLAYEIGLWLEKVGRADAKGVRKAMEDESSGAFNRKLYATNLSLWYNPAGKNYMLVAKPEYVPYKAFVHDTDLYLMLARVQLTASNEHDPRAALARLAAETINPATGKPVVFDPVTGMLSTDGLQCKHELETGGLKCQPVTLQALASVNGS